MDIHLRQGPYLRAGCGASGCGNSASEAWLRPWPTPSARLSPWRLAGDRFGERVSFPSEMGACRDGSAILRARAGARDRFLARTSKSIGGPAAGLSRLGRGSNRTSTQGERGLHRLGGDALSRCQRLRGPSSRPSHHRGAADLSWPPGRFSPRFAGQKPRDRWASGRGPRNRRPPATFSDRFAGGP